MRANDRIILMALGGAQEVGASCYYLKLGGYNFLLDCGTGQSRGIVFSPNFDALLHTNYIQDLNQISNVFISHAHLDHVAALPNFLQLNQRAVVYMTDFTFQIAELQLGTKFSATMKERISRVTFLQKLPLEDLSISFHQAGHIPGAMMTLFNFRGKKILYTGDYSTEATELVDAANFPREEIDTLIICAVHARHSMHRKNDWATTKILHKIQSALKNGRKVFCRVNQISKGVELIALIKKYLPRAEIFMDNRVMQMIHCFEAQHVPIMNVHMHPLEGFVRIPSVIVSTHQPKIFRDTEIIDANFSLHDDFDSVVNLVAKVNPKVCIVVHSPPDKFNVNMTLEQALIRNADSRTKFIFPKLLEPFEI